MAVLVAEFKSKREANFVAEIIHKMQKEAKVLTGERWEDLYLARMIDEGMEDEKEISEKDFSAKLSKRIKALATK